jgi:hypothetical protein
LAFSQQSNSELMTFEGRNFDIFAEFLHHFFIDIWIKNKTEPTTILIWNFTVPTLVNIVVNALFSNFHQSKKFAFDQPNIADFKFSFFSWLLSQIL